MDHESFDHLARLMASVGSRRAALGALLGTGAAGALGIAEGAKKHRHKNRKSGKKARGGVSAEAVCAPPSNGVNRNNCTYDLANFSGQALHSSSYKNTTWVGATLIETDLHSSNFKGGSFLNANLCGAELHSSTLTNVNFQGANLALADLHSSGCAGANFTPSTTFCGTIDCNGNIRNDDCPGGPPSNLCCQNCGVGGSCVNNECVCNEDCVSPPACGPNCFSVQQVGGGPCACIDVGSNNCNDFANCTAGTCPNGFACIPACCGLDKCIPLCGSASPTAATASRRSGGGGQVVQLP